MYVAQTGEMSSTRMAALRCQVSHHEFTEDYNGFLRANRYAIQQMNDRLKAHFIKAAGPAKGQTAYDSFTTSLANSHGGEGASAEICDGMAALAREAGLMAGSTEGLLMLAARQGLAVSLPEGVCAGAGMTTALGTPVAAIGAASFEQSRIATASIDPAMAAPSVAP